MLTLDTVCDFTWMWDDRFHLETEDGKAYIWSDPDYGGDNTIRPTFKTQADYAKEFEGKSMAWGRDKGKHTIRDYCGEDVEIIEGS